MNVHVITQPQNSDERWLVDAVKRQAKQAGIGMPEVGIFDHTSPNAFATGWNRNNSLVAVSTGLLSHMTKAEVEAVLAHEISHVANGDMVTMTLLQGVINTFVVFLSRIIGYIVDRVVFKVERGHGPAYWIVSIVAQVILGILAQIIVMWFSRYREYRADAGAGKLVGNRNMIAALQSLKTNPDDEGLPTEMSALAINGGSIKALFSSHPPLDDRIKALQQPR
jgi:heat shock protein HtpX